MTSQEYFSRTFESVSYTLIEHPEIHLKVKNHLNVLQMC